MRIEVTQEDIDKGCRYKVANCPVARAIARASGREVAVGYTSLSAGARSYQLPMHVTQWIERFDDERAVKPFGFELDL